MTDSIEDRVLEAITRLQFLEPGRATPASTFEDLGMTSLDSLSLIADLEEQFQIEIPNDQAMAVSTVRQAVECVRRLVPPEISAGAARP